MSLEYIYCFVKEKKILCPFFSFRFRSCLPTANTHRGSISRRIITMHPRAVMRHFASPFAVIASVLRRGYCVLARRRRRRRFAGDPSASSGRGDSPLLGVFTSRAPSLPHAAAIFSESHPASPYPSPSSLFSPGHLSLAIPFLRC